MLEGKEVWKILVLRKKIIASLRFNAMDAKAMNIIAKIFFSLRRKITRRIEKNHISLKKWRRLKEEIPRKTSIRSNSL